MNLSLETNPSLVLPTADLSVAGLCTVGAEARLLLVLLMAQPSPFPWHS